MLRQVRLRARPAVALRWSRVLHSQCRQFWNRQQQIPPDVPTYFSPPPRSRGSRIKDMAIGSVLTIGAFFIYKYYTLRQAFRELQEFAEDSKEVIAIKEEFRQLFAEARESGDHDRLRDVTFSLPRRLFDKYPGEIVESGPLPGYAVDDELYGKERVPAADTLMFVEEDQETGLIGVVQIAINLELEDLRDRHSAKIALDPKEDKLAELFRRVAHQATMWKSEGKLDDDGQMMVVFQLRDQAMTCLLVKGGHFQTIDVHNLCL
ncbi:uncharacterized protein BCR38DRAFT_484823 [Pseudomassariella vexata]|uniref:Uncharacterized protein n=1 Tax=Pseudomassariella vexata TaxID=1141098 RepID=A0A1Y2E1R8_9PEZI|nr:uncharacterized protein BCR38DRAFT_484823 [Pseudomassariella vexata]ORY65397.1 hypothetical protein BCR38DRAFT_484823 [Pseudomassariella vexata]